MYDEGQLPEHEFTGTCWKENSIDCVCVKLLACLFQELGEALLPLTNNMQLRGNLLEHKAHILLCVFSVKRFALVITST